MAVFPKSSSAGFSLEHGNTSLYIQPGLDEGFRLYVGLRFTKHAALHTICDSCFVRSVAF